MERKDILKINKKLLKTFEKVNFEEEGHRYWITGQENKPIKSVSTLLKLCYDEFDTEKEAEKWSKSRGLPLDYVLAAWEGEGDIATSHGSKVHLIGEQYGLWKFLGIGERPMVIDKKSLGAIQFLDDLPDYLVPVAFELKMYSPHYWYTGTADIILYNTQTNNFIIADYKGFPLDTPILTNSGWKTMGTVCTKDKVFDKDGSQVGIKGVSTTKKKQCYKFKFDNTEEIISDSDHRWLVQRGGKGFTKELVMTSTEIFNYINSFEEKIPAHKNLKILNPKPIINNKNDLPIDPYVLGVWLGDGHSIDNKITQANELVWQEIEKRGYTIGKDLSQGGAGKAQTKTVFNLRKELKELNLLKNKHIPEVYLLSSFEQRLDLLRGFMDADGHFNKIRKRFVMSTTRRKQADYLVELLATFGIKSTLLETFASLDGKRTDAYHVCFTTILFNPFLCRNQEISFVTNKEHTYRRIVDVVEVGILETRCIEVDSPSSTYLIGKTLVVTHNTNKELYSPGFKKEGLLHINPKYNLLQDNFGKYSGQFSFYQILLEDMGFKVGGRVMVWLTDDKENKKLYKTIRTPNVTRDLRQLLDMGLHLD